MKHKIIFIFFFCILNVRSYVAAQEISGTQIIRNMKSRFENIRDYTVDLEASIKMENLRIPKLKMKMYYKNPDKFHYESKSFAMLPKTGLNFNPFMYDEEKYNFKVKGQESLDNISTYVLEIESKKQDKFKAPNTIIWVDAVNWVPKKIESVPNEKRKLQIKFTHSLIDNKYYLASKIEVEYDVPEVQDTQDLPPNAPPEAQKLKRGMKSSKGSVSIIFQNYKINTGLSDDLFKEKK